jgi:N-acetyl-gamma-glutamyl-phosphate reductase
MMHNYSASKNSNQPSSVPALIRVSVVGARGYSGLELAKILLRHPMVDLKSCFATENFILSDLILDEKAKTVACFKQDQILANLTDVVFLATPAEVSLELAPKILNQGKTVIDLSGAFRLKKSSYEKWYGFSHTEAEALKIADYGLLPFCGPKKSSLVANPGCYATAIGLALIPLLKKNLILPETLVIDAKSGTSGAGKKAAENLLFSEVSGDCVPYKVGRHQHLPEIQEAAELFAGVSVDPHFTTHLLPVDRGITVALYAKTTATANEISAAYQEAFADYPLVRFEAKVGNLAKLKNVVGTPNTHISFECVDGKLFVFSVIDNLMKGAASQAVENFNRLFDLHLSCGLVGGFK